MNFSGAKHWTMYTYSLYCQTSPDWINLFLLSVKKQSFEKKLRRKPLRYKSIWIWIKYTIRHSFCALRVIRQMIVLFFHAITRKKRNARTSIASTIGWIFFALEFHECVMIELFLKWKNRLSIHRNIMD